MTGPRNDLMRVHADDPDYVVQARAEAKHWQTARGGADAAAEPPEIVRPYFNRRFTGNEHTPWFETIANYGVFHRGVVLGAGGIPHETRILELNPSLHLTVIDISRGPLAERERDLAPPFPGRVSTQLADLNFIELPENSYDVVISFGAIHHVTNLEYLAAQVQRALTPGGYFFLHDYVGESERRFTSEKKQAFERVYNTERARQGRAPVTLGWSDGDDSASPFCGIRAAEILPVFDEALRLETVSTAGALWFPILFCRDPEPPRPPSLRWRMGSTPGLRKIMRRLTSAGESGSLLDPRFVEDLLGTGDRMMDAGELLPTNAFAIYRKR